MDDLKKAKKEMLKFLALQLKKRGKSIKEIAQELGITQKEVKELLK
jgi:predicted transcriptional regulator